MFHTGTRALLCTLAVLMLVDSGPAAGAAESLVRQLGGTTYHLEGLFSDDFGDLENWLPETNGSVELRDRRLIWDCSGGKRAGTIWCRRKFDGPSVIEFDAMPLGGANNLNFILYASHPQGLLETSDQRTGAYNEYHQFANYIVTYLTPDEARSQSRWRIRFRKNPGFELLSERFILRGAPYDRTHRLTYVSEPGGLIRFFVNGKLVHEHQGSSPLYRSGHHGFRTWNSRVALANFRVYRIAAAGQESGLQEVNPPAEPDSAQVLAILGGRLIDGRGGPPLENSAVIIKGNTISSAGPRDEVSIPEEATLVDATGISILPGLIDSHLHSINNLDIPAKFLAHGITAFRDPGHPFRFYQAVMQADQTMPRTFLTGAHLDAYPPIWPQQAAIVTGAEHASQIVSQHVERGASAIKTYFRLPLEYYPAVCETANRHGVPVTAHLELVDADKAILAGVQGIEHVTSFGTVLADPQDASDFKQAVSDNPSARRYQRYRLWATLDFDTSKKLAPLLELIATRDVFVSPTLAVFERRPGDEGATEVHARGFENMLKFVGLCRAQGATVVVGSHTSVPHAKSGWAYQRELELLVESGLTPLQAITAGTYDNARFFGAADRLGSVEPGKSADLVLVKGNPAEDIRAMYDVQRVMLNGMWVTDPAK